MTGRRRRKNPAAIVIDVESVGGPTDGKVDVMTIDEANPLHLLDNHDRQFLEIRATSRGLLVRVFLMPPLVTAGGR